MSWSKLASVVSAPIPDDLLSTLMIGTKWGTSTITYSFYSDTTGGTYNGPETGVSEVSEDIKANIRNIIENYIEPYINVDFVEVADTAANHGHLRYMFSNGEQVDNFYAYAQDLSSFNSLSGDIHLNPFEDFAAYWGGLDMSSGFRGGAGTHGFTTLIHETLHALGLKHPGNYNGEGEGEPPFLSFDQDNTDNTVMTYHFAGASASTPMPYDILALQHLYGARTSNPEDTEYLFDAVDGFTDGRRYWGSAVDPTKVTLWDSNGIDILNFSKLEYDASGYFFDLNEGGTITSKSSYKATPYQAKDDPSKTTYWVSESGTSIAYGAAIEDAIGSGSNDEIIGNASENLLFGAKGDDLIWGGDAIDRLEGGDGLDTLIGEVGSDDLIGGNGNDALIGGGIENITRKRIDVADDGVDWMLGGGGRDLFVLGRGNGHEVIADFKVGVDTLGLADGLRFGNLSGVTRGNSMVLFAGKDKLAVVLGVQVEELTKADFNANVPSVIL